MTTGNESDIKPPAWLNTLSVVTSISCIAILGWLALTPPDPEPGNTFLPRAIAPCVMDRDGYLRGELFGQVEIELDWNGSNMRCDGMYRPDGNGIRLVFDQHLDQDEPGLLLVLGIADVVLGEPVDELPVNITIIDQASGLFFSTPDDPRCWTTFSEQLELKGTIEETWRIDGEVYCAGPLPALNSAGSVTLGDISFSGIFKPAGI
jgi:hypothetical protein